MFAAHPDVTVAICGLAAVCTIPAMTRALRFWAKRYTQRGWQAALAAASGTAAAVVGWRFAADPALPAWWWCAVTGLGLAAIDVDSHRLPRPWVGTLATGGLAVFAVVAACTGGASALLRALTASLLVLVVGTMVHKLAPGHLGGGDITLSAALALYSGWLGWDVVVSGLVLGFSVLGIVAAVGWLCGLHDGRERIAAGPSLLLGFWIAVML